jgi:DNA methylase/ParB/Sulfiredoxin domain
MQRPATFYARLNEEIYKLNEFCIGREYAKRASQLESIPIGIINIGTRLRRDLGDLHSLAKSISEVGLLHPIVLNSKNDVLVAGQRRLEACKILGWHKIPVYYVNLNDIIKGEYHENVVRKGFTTSELVELKKAIEPLERKEAEERQRLGRTKGGKMHFDKNDDVPNSSSMLGGSFPPSNDNSVPINGGKTRDKLADYVGISHITLKKAEKIYDAAKKQPEKYGDLLKKLDQRRISTEKAFHQMKKLQLIEQLSKEKPIMKLPEGIKLYNGDFRHLSKQIPDNSIDLIFTDPPYAEKSVPLYQDLAFVAQRVLKPAGSLITYCGTYALQEILQYMKGADLQFNWIIAVKLKGPYDKFWRANVTIKWKPLLWLVKGNKLNVVDFIGDLIESSTPEKISHEWEQSIVEADHVISRLTVENQIILDPMLGSGTTGIAALNLGRKFIGIEINKETFDGTKSRIIEHHNKLALAKAPVQGAPMGAQSSHNQCEGCN